MLFRPSEPKALAAQEMSATENQKQIRTGKTQGNVMGTIIRDEKDTSVQFTVIANWSSFPSSSRP